MKHDGDPVFSFVLPAFNEEPNVGVMAERLVAVGEEIGAEFEIVWVDDGSSDGTGDTLDKLAETDPRIRVLHLSRNFGHMAALTAGLESARAIGAVICLDSDGQHPPELIPDMVARWQNGADIVQMVRNPAETEGVVKRVSSKLFYKVFNLLGDIDIPRGAADFRLMDRHAVDALNSLPEHVRFLRGLVHWVGYTMEYVPYDAPARLSGETKYSFFKMISFAFNGITSFSTYPLRLSFLMATMVILAVAVYVAYVLVCYFWGEPLTPGWTSLLFAILLLGAAQLLAIGIASEYLARIFIEQKVRPVYLLRKKTDTAARKAMIKKQDG